MDFAIWAFANLLGAYGRQGEHMGSLPLLSTDLFLKIKTRTCISICSKQCDCTKAFFFFREKVK